MNNKLLEAEHISKSFFSIKVLDEINFSIDYGEVLGLVGENGAGKSTLVKILTGVHKPDQGNIKIDGSVVNIKNITFAKNLGINIVFQELSLTKNLSVAENIFIGKIPSGKLGFIDKKKLYEKTNGLIKKFKVGIRAHDIVERLSIGNMQIVEILKAVSSGPKLLIMDEPTSSLEKSEVENLFKLIAELKKNDFSIIYISHYLDEVFRITDNIMVLRDGKKVDVLKTKDVTKDDLIRKMLNKNIQDFFGSGEGTEESTEILLETKNLSDNNNFRNVSFTLKKGEIIGFVGLVGSGKVEVCRTLFGLSKKYSGKIILNGREIALNSPVRARQQKIGFIPENRKVAGLFLRDSVRNNIISGVLRKVSKSRFLHNGKIADVVTHFINLLRIKVSGYNEKIKYLSGGNQQKILVSKCLAAEPSILIAVDPTRGIDIGSKVDIHEILREQAGKGVGILLVSSELDEVVNMSDKIYVFVNGVITETFSSENFDNHKISLAINRGLTEKEYGNGRD
jgi:ABC-type sugar transport system ATPase subunit